MSMWTSAGGDHGMTSMEADREAAREQDRAEPATLSRDEAIALHERNCDADNTRAAGLLREPQSPDRDRAIRELTRSSAEERDLAGILGVPDLPVIRGEPHNRSNS